MNCGCDTDWDGAIDGTYCLLHEAIILLRQLLDEAYTDRQLMGSRNITEKCEEFLARVNQD